MRAKFLITHSDHLTSLLPVKMVHYGWTEEEVGYILYVVKKKNITTLLVRLDLVTILEIQLSFCSAVKETHPFGPLKHL